MSKFEEHSNGGMYRKRKGGKWERNPWHVNGWDPYSGYLGLALMIFFWGFVIWLVISWLFSH